MNGNKIEVELIAKANDQSIAAAGKRIAEGVGKQQQATGPAVAAAGAAKRTAKDWVEEQRAFKAGGGQWLGTKWGPPPGGGGAGGGGAGGAGGMAAAGAAGGIAGALVNGIVNALQFMIQTLTNAIQSAFLNAASLYAKALRGGAGMGYAASTESLASIIGVGENEVLAYGNAVKYVNERLGDSVQVIAKTAPILTTVTWEFRTLQYQVSSIFATIASEAAPALIALAQSLRVFMTASNEYAKRLRWAVNHLPGNMIVNKLRELIFGKATGPGAPQASIHRLAGSAWERMGFVVGRGGANHAAQTAANTKRIANLMATLVKGPKARGSEGGTLAIPQGA